jgi:serine/threonine-protein kinase
MDRVRILDFGIAKLTNAASSPSARTRSGLILGTPLYMSPEQCRGVPQIDLRADVYALGCILFAMLTGRPPFALDLPGDLISAHLHQEPPRPSSLVASLPPEVDAVVARALSKRPEDRHGSMAALAQDLQTIPVTLPRTVILPPTSTPYVRAAAPPRALTPEPQGFTTLSRAASETNSTPTSVRARWKLPLLIGTGIIATAAAIMVAQLWPRSHKLTVVEAPLEPPVLPRPAPQPARAAAPAPEPVAAPGPARAERPVPTHVTVEVANPRTGLTVTVDGRPARLPLRLRRDGATHQLRFEAPSFKAETRTIAADRDQRVRLKYVPSLFME